MHRIASEHRGIGANWRFARLVAPSAARSQANQAAAGADFDHLWTKAEAEGLDGGEGGIRTLGTGYPVRQISNLVPSTTRPPLRSLNDGWGLNNYALITELATARIEP